MARHRGDEHGQGLGIGQRLEQTAFLGLEGQDRKERDGDDQEGEEARTGDLLDGRDDDRPVVARPSVLLPLFEPLVGLLDDDDGGVDQGADGDGDAAEGHDVGRDPHQPEGDEGQKNRDRDGDDRDEGARDVPEEEEDR